MENKLIAFVSTSNSMFRSSMSHSDRFTNDCNCDVNIGNILIIIAPFIVWLIIRDKDK